MQVIRTFVTALLVTLVVQPSAECQPSRDVGALQRQVRALIDDGRYVEAEREARALFASFGTWALYNGGIAYGLIAAMFGAELLTRSLLRNRLRP